MKVRIHWNLNKGGLVLRGWPNVVGDMKYPVQACVRNARFVVHHKTREAIRDGKQMRSVHAWVEGDLCGCGKMEGIDIRYNPKRDAGFVVRGTNQIVTAAEHVGVRALGTGRGAGYETRARDAR